MGNFIHSLAKATVATVEVNLSRTALTPTAFDVTAYEGTGVFVIPAGAATAGSTPLFEGKLQHCAVTGGTYTDVAGATFASISAAAATLNVIVVDMDKLLGFVKFVPTFSSSLALPFGVQFIGHKKYT